MSVKKSSGDLAFDVCNYIFMILLIIIMLYPMLNVLAISMSSSSAISGGRVTWYPIEINFKGYSYILSQPMLYRGYINSIFYAITTTILMLIVTSLAAYALSVKDFALKKFFTIFLAITMFFGGGMIPTYLLIKNLNMINTMWVMIIPGCVSAWNVIVFRTFFQQIPNELRESAFIDGATEFTIWRKIIIPLSKPLLATFGLFSIVGSWNSWFNALLYLKDENLYPIQMFLRRMVVDGSLNSAYGNSQLSTLLNSGKVNPQNIQMAVVVLTMLPILMIYPFVQKHFVKGVMIGAIKG